MSYLVEARKNLSAVLTEEQEKQLILLLRDWLIYNTLSKITFVQTTTLICKTEEQLRCLDDYLNALLVKVHSPQVKNSRGGSEKVSFEMADFTEYVTPLSLSMKPQTIADRSAVLEYFLPDAGFISTRMEVHLWENGLDGADENVPGYLVQLCQIFIKNIITAMISKKESYKIRDKTFQYAFGFPVPDPFLKNSHKILDYTQESKVDVLNEEDTFVPAYKPSLEHIEQETAYAHACGKKSYSNDKLTVQLLYDTLRENPNIIGLHSINSTNLLKIGLQLEES